MPYTPPTVNYSTTHNGVYTSLTGVQSVSIRRGRERFQDPFPPTVCTIELIPANSYAIPLAIGQFIDVRDANTSTSPCYFEGVITDVSRTYEIPYNAGSGAAPGDRIVITAAGAVGTIGSANVNNIQMFAFEDATDSATRIIENSGPAHYSEPSGILCSGTFLTGPSLNFVNTYLQTGQLLIDDLDTQRSGTYLFVNVYTNKGTSPAGLSYSDTGATQFRSLEYQSSAQNTFNYVEVDPDGLTPQVTKAVSTRFNSLVYSTYNISNSDALSLSGYLFNLLSGQLTPVPFTLATETTVDASCINAAKISTTTVRQPIIGQNASITFRGTTVSGQIQGVYSNFYVDRANVQLYFSPSLGVPFTLDSTTAGILDTNRLGLP